MLEKWTGTIVGKMHVHKLTMEDVAKEMGVTKSYVSMILNGVRKPDGIKKRMEEALDALIKRKSGKELGE